MKKIQKLVFNIFLFVLTLFCSCTSEFNYAKKEGNYIIFSGRDRVSSGFHLYISDLNDGYPRKISWNPFNDKEPVIDNNGKVYFLSDREGGQKLFSFDLNWVGGTIDWQGDWIWESYPEAENAKLLFNDNQWYGFHNISPTGLHLVSMQYPLGQYDIVIFDKNGLNKKILTGQKFDDYFPQFSKDGLVIFYQKKVSNTNMEIYSVDIDGSFEKNLTNHNSNDYISLGPSISPDDKRIVFTSDRSGSKDIFIMNIDGTKEKNLTNSEFNDFNPVFSPVDEKIAYVSDRSGNDDIYLYDIKNNNLKKISNSDSNESLPKFSPDGAHIAYISDKESILKVYCYNIKTSKITNIVKSPHLSGASFDFYQVK